MRFQRQPGRWEVELLAHHLGEKRHSLIGLRPVHDLTVPSEGHNLASGTRFPHNVTVGF
jgi:hypothetical protein